MGLEVGDKKSGQNRKADAFLNSQQKKKFNFFFDFFGPDFVGPEIGPRNFGRVERTPPTSMAGTSGPGGRRRKKWSKSKTGRVFEIATKT